MAVRFSVALLAVLALSACLGLVLLPGPDAWAGAQAGRGDEVVAVALRHFPPQYDLDKSGKPVGFAIDIFDAVARRKNLKVTYLVADDWDAAFAAVADGRADVLPNLGISKERAALFDFTLPVETFSVMLFVRSATHDIAGPADLAGRRVATSRMNVAQSLLSGRGDLDLVVRDTVQEAFVDLISGHVDVLAAPEPVVMKIAREARLENRIKRAGPPLVEVKRAVAVRRGDARLYPMLSDAVAEFVGTREYQDIYAAWYGRPEPFWTAARAALAAGLLLLAVVVGMAAWRWRAIGALNAELRAGEVKFRGLFEASPVAMALVDRTGMIESLNGQFVESFGYAPDVLRRVDDWFALAYLDEETRALSAEAWRSLAEGCGENWPWTRPAESRVTCRDGAVRHVTVKMAPVGECLLVALHDISDRVRAEEGIKASLREKEVLLREMHHRVKNNLQIMNSLLYLQLDRISDPGSRSLVQASQARIHSMALVHEELYRSDDLSSVDMRNYIINLVSHVGVGAGSRIRAETEIGEVRLPITKSVPFGLLVNELLTNAVKHAFIGVPGGVVRIDVKREGDSVVMKISDNGVGLPEGFDCRRSSSLGLTLVSSLVDQLHGAMDAYNDRGANFVVRFPCH
ncbi:MAG: transporter substrate-binding domain-containing protein [Thermodesulfobacteriota bacterium]